MRHLYPVYLFWPKFLFSGSLRNFTPQNPFSQGDISWHSFLSLRSFSFLCFQIKKMELHVKNVGSGPSLALWRNFIQLKQIKGTPEERASCSWPYFYLHPSFLPTKRKKTKILSDAFLYLARARIMHNSHEHGFFKLLLLNCYFFSAFLCARPLLMANDEIFIRHMTAPN